MSRTILAALVLLLQLDLRVAAQEPDLRIRLIVPDSRVEIGQPLPLYLEFENGGENGLFLKRSDSYGPDAINISLHRGACEYGLEKIFFESWDGPERTWIPIEAGDRFVQRLLSINEPGISVGLPGPGTYSLRASFRSQGPAAEGTRRRIWRGSVATPDVTVEFVPPAAELLKRMRAALRASVASREPDFEALHFFLQVKDADAADLLVELLDRWDVNPVVLDAIANQNRLADIPIVERAISAVAPARDRSFSEYAQAFLARMRMHTTDPCR